MGHVFEEKKKKINVTFNIFLKLTIRSAISVCYSSKNFIKFKHHKWIRTWFLTFFDLGHKYFACGCTIMRLSVKYHNDLHVTFKFILKINLMVFYSKKHDQGITVSSYDLGLKSLACRLWVQHHEVVCSLTIITFMWPYTLNLKDDKCILGKIQKNIRYQYTLNTWRSFYQNLKKNSFYEGEVYIQKWT